MPVMVTAEVPGQTASRISNAALLSFGVWWLGPVRNRRPSTRPLAWGWVLLESVAV